MKIDIFKYARPVLRKLDPERAHDLTMLALKSGLYRRQDAPDDPRLEQNIWGLKFGNPVGIAAGFDKNAYVAKSLFRIGFGFVEVGTVTPKPQKGNEKPRIFRLNRDRAVINRLGFNSQGHEIVYNHLSTQTFDSVLGVNIGANKDSQNRNEDYVEGLHKFVGVADYFTINISSPNTPGLRDLQKPRELTALLDWLIAARGALMESGEKWCPLLVKIAPDLNDNELDAIVRCLIEQSIDGIIVSNTTTARNGLMDHQYANEVGGLSGRPLFRRSTQMLAKVYQMCEGTIPLIGVGGIDSGETALAKFEAGASLVQLYTGLVFYGPKLIQSIKTRLIREVEQGGILNISEIVGTKSAQWASGEQHWD
jgi:dihydroorotate dehydrogenase